MYLVGPNTSYIILGVVHSSSEFQQLFVPQLFFTQSH